jgi:phospholipase D1/2
MEEKSGIKFHQAQVALARKWMGDKQPKEGEWVPTEVEVHIPQETSEALLLSNKTEVKTEKIKIPADEHEADRIMKQFEAAANDGELHAAHNVSDNVVQHMLYDSTSLHQEDWVGTEEEELASYVRPLRKLRTFITYILLVTCQNCSISTLRL